MCDVALHLQRPDGWTPSLSDGDPGDYRTLLRRAGELFDRPDLLWAASGGAEGSPPATRAASFPVGGYFVQRSGWGDDGRAYTDERWSVLDCGPLGDGGHGHYDQLSVELMADGHPVVVDPGRYTYAEDDSGLASVVQGDRRPQHRDRRRPRPDAVPPRASRRARPRSRDCCGGTPNRAWTPCAAGWSARSTTPSTPGPSPSSTTTTGWSTTGCAPAAPTTTPPTGTWTGTPRAAGGRPAGTRQTVVTTPPATLVVPDGYGDVGLGPGWVSPAYGVRHAAPVVLVSAGDRVDADLVTVLAPGDEVPQVTVRHRRGRAGRGGRPVLAVGCACSSRRPGRPSSADGRQRA